MNSGAPARAADGPVREAITSLGAHLSLWPARRRSDARKRSWGRAQSGQAAVEFLGLVPVLFMVVGLAFQLALTGLSAVFAGVAASEGARLLAVDTSWSQAEQAAADRLPDRWGQTVRLRDGGFGPNGQRTVEAAVRLSIIVPFVSAEIDVRANAGYIHEPSVAGRRP